MKGIVLINYGNKSNCKIGDIYGDYRLESFVVKDISVRHDTNKPYSFKAPVARCIRCDNERTFNSLSEFVRAKNRCDCFIYEDGFTIKQRQTVNLRLRFAKSGAKDRGIIWDLSWLEFCHLIKQNCHYCGSSPTAKSITTQKNYTDKCKNSKHEDYKVCLNGIDRIDSSIGYHEFNCVPCCMICNRAKNDMDTCDFFNHIIKIVKHNNLV